MKEFISFAIVVSTPTILFFIYMSLTRIEILLEQIRDILNIKTKQFTNDKNNQYGKN